MDKTETNNSSNEKSSFDLLDNKPLEPISNSKIYNLRFKFVWDDLEFPFEFNTTNLNHINVNNLIECFM